MARNVAALGAKTTIQWRLYGNFDNGKWKENTLSSWKDIKDHNPNRYQAALAQGVIDEQLSSYYIVQFRHSFSCAH